MVTCKSKSEIEKMRRAGRIVAEALALVESELKPGVSTAHLDRIAEKYIRDNGAVPSFKGLYNFPANICTSINNEIVHGIPSRRRVLIEGDIVSVDVGVKFEGYHTDSATTVPVGHVPTLCHAQNRAWPRGASTYTG